MKFLKKMLKIILRTFGFKLIRLGKPYQPNPYGKINIETIKCINNAKGILHLGAHKGTEAEVYKWYGKNLDVSIPEFNQNFDYIKTIGVSLFREKTSTSRHFGPMRLTYRILYNFNKVKNEGSYIEADGKINTWKKNSLFIFDDTLIHQSFNEEDDIRYCAFIDIVRPSYLNKMMAFLLAIVGFLLKKTRGIFYKNWRMI